MIELLQLLTLLFALLVMLAFGAWLADYVVPWWIKRCERKQKRNYWFK